MASPAAPHTMPRSPRSATVGPLPPAPPGPTLVARFIQRYARRYAGVYVLGVAFLLATNGLTVLIPRLIKTVIDNLAEGSSEVDIYARYIGVAALGVIVVRTLSRVLFFNPGRTIEYRVRNDMLATLLSMSTTFFHRAGVGDLVSRAINDATFVRAIVGFAVLNLLNLCIASATAIWQMLLIDPWLTLWCTLPLAASTWLMRVSIKWMYGRMKAAQAELGQLSVHILESYGGVAVIQGGAATDAFVRRFDGFNDRYTELNLQVAAVRCFVMPVARAIGSVCIFLLLLIGGQRTIEGELSVGDLAAYASFVSMLVAALAMSGWLLNSLQRGYVSLQRVWQVLDLETDRPQGDEALPVRGGGLSVEVSGLSWRFGDAELALHDLSFSLPAGQVLGVYGPVGSGKSTLVNLLSGLFAPPPGTIALDGVDLRSIDADSLRRDVAVVPQESFLFSRSLRDNIGYVDPVDDIDDARVHAAAIAAALTEDIERLDDGLDTVVGERGLMLSGGQRQRAQIARALYAGARLLILDDVLSAVDHDTEAQLLAALRAEITGTSGRGGGCSAIIISSRLSALAGCDEILVLDQGGIVERGDHATLAASGGLYAQAWAVQRDDDDAGDGDDDDDDNDRVANAAPRAGDS